MTSSIQAHNKYFPLLIKQNIFFPSNVLHPLSFVLFIFSFLFKSQNESNTTLDKYTAILFSIFFSGYINSIQLLFSDFVVSY